MAAIEKHCTLLINYDKGTFSATNISELLQQEEEEVCCVWLTADTLLQTKITGMRQLILMMLNGENMNHLVMDVIRYQMSLLKLSVRQVLFAGGAVPVEEAVLPLPGECR